ncbi:hypothetical protein JYT44_02930 [Caldithrix abyssi]|nr:hypothetical protein [Caldithrix abyssi]
MSNVGTIGNGSAATEFGSLGQASMAKDDFLKLLIEQLKYQDPLSPMESQDFAAQLAQFSSLEQLKNMSGMMEESINVDLMLTQAINNTMATNFIGKSVAAVGDTINLKTGEAVDLTFKLKGQAETVKVKILDVAGNVVKEIEMGALSSGKHTLNWDGKNLYGETLPAGEYRFEIEALDANQEAVGSQTMILGMITGIKYGNSGAVFMVDGKEIPFNKVLEITQVEG